MAENRLSPCRSLSKVLDVARKRTAVAYRQWETREHPRDSFGVTSAAAFDPHPCRFCERGAVFWRSTDEKKFHVALKGEVASCLGGSFFSRSTSCPPHWPCCRRWPPRARHAPWPRSQASGSIRSTSRWNRCLRVPTVRRWVRSTRRSVA